MKTAPTLDAHAVSQSLSEAERRIVKLEGDVADERRTIAQLHERVRVLEMRLAGHVPLDGAVGYTL